MAKINFKLPNKTLVKINTKINADFVPVINDLLEFLKNENPQANVTQQDVFETALSYFQTHSDVNKYLERKIKTKPVINGSDKDSVSNKTNSNAKAS